MVASQTGPSELQPLSTASLAIVPVAGTTGSAAGGGTAAASPQQLPATAAATVTVSSWETIATPTKGNATTSQAGGPKASDATASSSSTSSAAVGGGGDGGGGNPNDASTSTDGDDGSGSGMGIGIIVAIAVAIILVACLLAVAALRRKKLANETQHRERAMSDCLTDDEKRGTLFEMTNPAFSHTASGRGVDKSTLSARGQQHVSAHADNPLYSPANDGDDGRQNPGDFSSRATSGRGADRNTLVEVRQNLVAKHANNPLYSPTNDDTNLGGNGTCDTYDGEDANASGYLDINSTPAHNAVNQAAPTGENCLLAAPFPYTHTHTHTHTLAWGLTLAMWYTWSKPLHTS